MGGSDESKAIVAAIRALSKKAQEPEEDNIEWENDDFTPLPSFEEDWELLDTPDEPASTEDPLQARLKRIMSRKGMK